MASNFQVLLPQWPEIAASAQKVEALAHSDPRTACFYARRTLEAVVDWLFDNDSAFYRPYDRNLAALISEPTFTANVPPQIALKARTIKDIGNLAVHSNKPIRTSDATRCAA